MVKNKTRIIAIDFDDTITTKSDFPITGELRKDAQKYINLLANKGYTLILWTARKEKYYDEAVSLIIKWQLPIIFPSSSYYGKIEADFYIDDRAIIGKLNWKKIYKYIINNIKL